ncbi:MAG: class I SAM-dependent methyltransferase [Chloroflexi bacterium]|nr:MAG: class I SAM-dependent methyltransferase [Chloroflexota bacterium]
MASLPVLAAFGGEGTVVVTAVFAFLAGLTFSHRQSRSARFKTAVLSTLILTGIAILIWPPALLSQQLSPYKTLSVLSNALDTRHLLTEWDATARVDAVESSTIHMMPGLSLLSPLGPPPQAGLMLDGDNLMPITGLSSNADDAAILADHLPAGLAYRLKPNGRVLVIEAGTGMDVLWALAAGAEGVTAVIENRLVIETMQQTFAPFTHDLYNHPNVTIANQSGRVYTRQPGTERFDLVVVALTDSHRPVTSGAYSLTEDYVYTVEAIEDYLRVLDEDGLLVITRWLQTPPSESGRLFGTIVAALSAEGKNPADHLIAFRTLRTMTVLTSLHPFTAAEIAETHTFTQQRAFDVVHFPGMQIDDANRYNVLPEPTYFQLFQDILHDPAATSAEYRFDIRPPTDNRPFFFHYFRWQQTPEILASLGLTWQPFGGSGFFVLVALLLLVSLAAAVFIIGPLLFKQRFLPQRAQKTQSEENSAPSTSSAVSSLQVFVYFACLGLAFLFVEIPLAQRFILVLGQPVTALAIVIFTVLLFSGLGSFTVYRWRLSAGLGVLVVLITIYPLLLPPVSSLALRLPEWGRIGLTILTLAPVGYLMGLPFAGGLRVVEQHNPAFVPWAWAINGSFSVISSVLAVMAALTWGFAAVLWLGATAYAVALLAFRNA